MITQTGFVTFATGWLPQQMCPTCNGTGIIMDYTRTCDSTAAYQRCCWECNGRGMVSR